MNAIAIEIVRGLSHHHHNHTHNEYDQAVDHEPPQDEDTPFIFKILAVLWMLFMAAICYKADQREQEENARIERRRQRRLARRLKERKLDPKRREPVVAAAMKTKEMTDSSFLMDANTDITQENEDLMCTICLDPFEIGDEITFSRHLRCLHCFHKDCVIPWMMLNDDCPMCRTRLIDDDGKSRTLSEEFFDDDDEDDDQMQRFQIVNGLIRFMRGNSPGSPLRTVSSGSLEMQEMDSTGHSSSIDATQKQKPVSNKTRRKKNKKYASLASGDEDEVEMSTLDTSISNDNDEDGNDNSDRIDSIV